MEKLTFYDIQKILEQLNDRRSSGIKLDHFLNEDTQNHNDFQPGNKTDAELYDKLGKFKKVTLEPVDREGYGNIEFIEVYHFEDHNVYVRFKGYWSSYAGIDFESMREVKPITKTVTVYE